MERETSYRIIESTSKSDGLEGQIVYGIEIDGYDTIKIEDISSNKQKITEFISLLKKNKVEPNQVIYIVEDFLGEY